MRRFHVAFDLGLAAVGGLFPDNPPIFTIYAVETVVMRVILRIVRALAVAAHLQVCFPSFTDGGGDKDAVSPHDWR
jgi:hypothetical protein